MKTCGNKGVEFIIGATELLSAILISKQEYSFLLLIFFFNLGGHYLPVGDERCTHLVVEESTVKDLPFEPLKKLYVVKQEVSAENSVAYSEKISSIPTLLLL